MPQRWKDQYEHLGLSATILQGCMFKLRLGDLPRKDIYTYVLLIISYCIYYCRKDPIEATLFKYMILSLDSNSGCAMTD